MSEDEYDAWCWDNRKFFNEWWLDFSEYEKHLPKAFTEEETSESFQNTLVQNRPVHYENSSLRKIMNYTINYGDGVFQSFSFPLFKEIEEQEILLTLISDEEIVLECVMTRMYGNQFQIGIFSDDMRSFCYLLHLLQYNRDFDVLIRGENWEIKTFLKGNLSAYDTSCSLKKMLNYLQSVMRDSFSALLEAYKDLTTQYLDEFQSKPTSLIKSITKFILKKSGITKTSLEGKISYSYTRNHKNEYTEFMRSLYISDVKKQTYDLYRFSIEHIVISFPSLFDCEILYLSKILWNYFLGEEFDFEKIVETMNSLVERNHDYDDVTDFLNSENIYENL